MTAIKIIAVGRIKEEYFREGIRFYLKEIRRYCPAEIIECPDQPAPDRAGPALKRQILDTEGERILSHVRREDYLVALCIDGKQYSSRKWKGHIRTLFDKADRMGGSLLFVIGGSYGLADSVLGRAQERLSFSAMTFPHQMMRMILAGQIAEVWKQS